MANLFGIANQKVLPSRVADGSPVALRMSGYGDLMVMPLGVGSHGLAVEGSYFRALNPTMGTGIASGIQTAFSDTANVLMTLYNAGSLNVILDYIRLINTVAGATTTSSHLAFILDSINRRSSGGSLLTNANCNSASALTSALVAYFGAVTAAAASAKRQVSRAALKTQAAPCWVIGDEVLITFGQQPAGDGPISGAAAGRFLVPCGPIVIAPGHTGLLHVWNPANATTAPSWEVEVGWWER